LIKKLYAQELTKIENNIQLKEAIKSQFRESRGNLKRKAEKNVISLMRGIIGI